MFEVFRKLLFVQSLRLLFLALLTLDVVLVAVYGIKGLAAIGSGTKIDVPWNISHSSSVLSYLNYLKLLFAAISLIVASKLFGDRGLWLIALAVCLLLVDDFFELHDWAAWHLGGLFEGRGIDEVHQQSRGEPIVFALFGALVLGLLVAGYQTMNVENKKTGIAILTALFLFAFFATVVDVLHGFSELVISSKGRAITGIFSSLEEGGESLALSLLVVICLWTVIYKERFGER